MCPDPAFFFRYAACARLSPHTALYICVLTLLYMCPDPAFFFFVCSQVMHVLTDHILYAALNAKQVPANPAKPALYLQYLQSLACLIPAIPASTRRCLHVDCMCA
jgi:hypothetical protein